MSASRRQVLQGTAAVVGAAAMPTAVCALATVAPVKPVQPMMDYAQLATWARTEGRFSDPELFFADGVEDTCDNCDCYSHGVEDSVRPIGTPMVCYRASYEYEEYDTKCVQCIFDDHWFWEHVTDDEVREML